MTRGVLILNVMVVLDSGSGELAGLSGSMVIGLEGGQHFYDFNSMLEAPSH